jgi:SAM-dependent methyltransferase
MLRHLRKLSNLADELRLGISTRGIVPADKPDAVHYASAGYSDTRQVLQRLHLQPSDTFVDIGAGKGRVLCLAAQHRLQKVVGVEYSSELVRIAMGNVSRMRGRRTPVEVFSQAAEDFDYSAATVLYLFNPFEANILDVVLHKVNGDRGDRPVRLAFVFEKPEQRVVFLGHKWLECYSRWINSAGHPVALYRTFSIALMLFGLFNGVEIFVPTDEYWSAIEGLAVSPAVRRR